MISITLPNIKCLNENHASNITMVCLNKHCTDPRLVCRQCIKSGLHQKHKLDVEELTALVEFIDTNNDLCDSLYQNISKQGDLTLESFFKFKNEIKTKHHIPKESFLKMDIKQMNQAINQMFSFKDYEQQVSRVIVELSKELKTKLDKLHSELSLKTINFSQVNKDDEKSSCNLYNAGFNLFSSQKFDEALKVIDQTLKQNPNNRDSLWCKGECLLMKNNLKEALNWYNQAISVDPKHINSLAAKADCLRGLGQFNDAIIFYDQALSINSKHIDSLFGKGDCLREMGEYEESLRWLNQALLIKPKDYFSLQSKGVCLQELQKFSEALSCFDQALMISQADQFIKMRKEKCEIALRMN